MYIAKLLNRNELLEEEIFIEINSIVIDGFMEICPYEHIYKNKHYPVELYLTFLNSSEFTEIECERYGLEKFGTAFGYILYGKVEGDSINIGNGIKIKDDIFKEYSYLDGKFVKLKVDRIGVEFLSSEDKS